ncbi:MAG: lipopolysaccharide heptosyltransferase I [Porticoccaceae bacterium]
MRVLIVKLTSMGDLVQALPALSDARRARPDVVFDWAVDEAFAEVPAWHPAVARVIKTAHRRWRSAPGAALRDTPGQIRPFLRELRATRYDVVIDAQTNLKSALVTACARGPKHGPDRASVREYPAHWAYRHRYPLARDQLAVARWRQLFAQVFGYPVPDSAPDFGLAGRQWPAVGDMPAGDYLVAVPNASWDNKYWIDRHWRQVIGYAAQAGMQVLLTSGSEQERERCRRIAEGLDNAVVLPRKTLSEIAALLLASRGAICMDTGLAHVSAALDVPTLTLYGPTDPALIGATGGRSRHLLASGYPCIPCYNRLCSVPGYQGPEAQCLKKIMPDEVWQAFCELAGWR